MEYALEAKGVTKSFVEKGKKLYALKDVSISVKKGEVFGLLGPNGAGKTTLMNVITGMVLPDKGEISILGKKNTDKDIFDRINGIFAEARFHWNLKPKDILRFYCKAYNIPKAKAESKIDEMIDMFEIRNVLNTKFSQLSTGERTRLAFAKAMINDPEVLLLDEPTLGLDPTIALKIRNMVKKVNKEQGMTILLTSHYMLEVEMLADKVAFINRGKIVDTGNVEHVKMKHFNTYDLWVKPREMLTAKLAKEEGFEIKGVHIFKVMDASEELSEILARLHNKGIKIDDIKVKRPTLEDYFIKLSKQQATEDEG